VIRVEVERLKNLTSCNTTGTSQTIFIMILLSYFYLFFLCWCCGSCMFMHVSNRSASKMSSSFSLFVGMIDTKVKPVRYAPQKKKEKRTQQQHRIIGSTRHPPGPQSVLRVTFPSSSVTCSEQRRSWEDRLQREDYDGTPSWTESEQPAMNRITTCSLTHRNAYMQAYRPIKKVEGEGKCVASLLLHSGSTKTM